MSRIKALLLVSVVLIPLVIGSFLVLHSSINPAVEQPQDVSFDYLLSISPLTESIMRGQSVTVNVTVTYLRGSEQPVTLNVAANSANVQLLLSTAMGTPKPNQPFTSNLTIQASDFASATFYSVNITASASNSVVHSTAYTLEVVSSQIQLSGTVTTNSTDDIYPIKLQFVSQQNNAIYYATLSFPSLPKLNMLQRQATYTVSLPNEQTYKVIGTWARLFGPWISPTDLPEGTFDCGTLQVDCKAGKTTINRDFTG